MRFVPFSQLPPATAAQYQPGVSLQQTQTGIQSTQAQIPGQEANSNADIINAQQKAAPQALAVDLKNKMTLKDALGKYTALKMSPDDIFTQYLNESPWGLPKEDPIDLQNMGVSADTLGKLGTPGSRMDQFNTKNVINEIRKAQDLWHQTNSVARLGDNAGLSAKAAEYNTFKTYLGNHLSTVVPGAPGGESTAKQFLDSLPDPKDVRQNITGMADGKFSAAEQASLLQKGYTTKMLGLSDPKAPPTTKQSSGGELLNNLLGVALPTVGGIAGGIAGGVGGALIPGADLTGVPEFAGAVGGSAVGSGGGQALADIIAGKKPGGDVLLAGALGGLGEGAGALLGGVLGKVGGALANKVGDNVFDKVVSASPNYAPDIAALKNTANKYGLMNGSVGDGIAQMPKAMNDIGEKIQTGLAQVKTPVNLADVDKSILTDFSKQTSSFENTADFENAQKFITKRLYSGTGNDNPLSEILDSKGNQIAKANATTTYSDLYNLKSEVAKDLAPVFKAQANPSAAINLSPKQEANLSLWNGLKDVIDKADPNIRVLNDDQHNMFNIAKGFVKTAGAGKSGGGFAGDIFDTLAGSMVGGPPGAVASLVGGRFIKSEGGRAVLSKLLQNGAIKSGFKGIGAGAGSGLGGMLGLSQ